MACILGLINISISESTTATTTTSSLSIDNAIMHDIEQPGFPSARAESDENLHASSSYSSLPIDSSTTTTTATTTTTTTGVPTSTAYSSIPSSQYDAPPLVAAGDYATLALQPASATLDFGYLRAPRTAAAAAAQATLDLGYLAIPQQSSDDE
jgi:hypothetical protein